MVVIMPALCVPLLSTTCAPRDRSVSGQGTGSLVALLRLPSF